MRDKEIKKLLRDLHIYYFILLGSTLFIGKEVWDLGEGLNSFVLYSGLIMLFRIFILFSTIPIVLNNKQKYGIIFSFLSIVLLGLFTVIVRYELLNMSVLTIIVIYAFLVGLLTGYFQLFINQYIIEKLNSDEYDGFLYEVGFYKNLTDVLLPLIFIASVFLYNDILGYGVLSIIAVLGVRKTLLLGDLEGSEKYKVKDLFTRRKIDVENIKLHYIYIFISAILVQYLDLGTYLYQYEISDTITGLGIMKIILLLLSLFIVWVKSKTKSNKDIWWLYGGFGLMILVLLSEIFLNSGMTNNIYLLMVFSIVIYIVNNSSSTLSLKLIKDYKGFDKFKTLFWRGIIYSLGKLSILVVGFIFSFNSTNEIGYNLLTIITILFTVVALIMSYNLNKKYM